MRYALFYTPPENHELTRLAATWLGRNPFSGTSYEHRGFEMMPAARLADLTAAPRRYGFHATLKAPFYLTEDQTENQLISAVEAFCEHHDTFEMPMLKVGRLGPFFALVPADDADELNRFASQIVRQFDQFRAPMSEADYARRKPDQLDDQQRANLQQWGYPYIFDNFRFHMTLTGPVPEHEAQLVTDILTSQFNPLLQAPLNCTHLTVFCEAGRGAPFRVRCSIPLAPSQNTKAATP